MWGELWGSMIWGVVAVPMTGPIGLAFLIGLLMGASVVLHRRRLTRTAAACAVLAITVGPLMALADQVSLPHSFTNATPAEAGEVNANFAVLRDAFNQTAGRLGHVFTPPGEGPLPASDSPCFGKVVGEVWLFSGNFEPEGTVFARGQLLEILQYPSLYPVIYTTYGGDGRTNFAVPDLQGLEPEGVNYVICVNGVVPTRN
jgi:Phage Tail Collar Domain